MTRCGIFPYEPDLVYCAMTRCGLFHYEPHLIYSDVYFTVARCGLFHYDQIWSISLRAKYGLLHYEPDPLSTSLLPDVVYLTMSQVLLILLWPDSNSQAEEES